MKTANKFIVILLLISVAATILPFTASANGGVAYGAATVSADDVRVRSGPGTTHSVITHLMEGDIVVVLERTNSEWHKVNFHGTTGFISVPLLRDIITAENFNARGRLTSDSVNMRERPGTSSNVLGSYNSGTTMEIIGINNGWFKIRHDNKTGYIRSDFIEILNRLTSTSAAVSKASSPASTRVIPTVPAPDPNIPLGQQMVDFAVGFTGIKYVYGGSSPSGFDCSGFTFYIYKQFGMNITRNASGQYRDNGVHIDKSELSPGDLVFFSSNGNTVTHVGIFIGGTKFVHSSSGSAYSVVVSDLNSDYYTRVWFGAKRLI